MYRGKQIKKKGKYKESSLAHYGRICIYSVYIGTCVYMTSFSTKLKYHHPFSLNAYIYLAKGTKKKKKNEKSWSAY